MEVEPEPTIPTAGQEVKLDKKVRKRKRKLHQAIRTQMEFYFSDSNLMKDKFLGKLLSDSEDGWVPLEVFFHFNRIRTLNCTITDICKAIKKSELLEVSPDEKSVRRHTPVNVKENVDQCTLYVEHLPVDVDHDWLTNTFSQFGVIDYVSLPRFKQKGTVKGFAFVEFATPDEALKACKHFGYVEDEIKSGGEEINEQMPKSKRKRGTSESDHKNGGDELSEQMPKYKRKRGTSESSDTGRKRSGQNSFSETSTKDLIFQSANSKQEDPIVKESEDEKMPEDSETPEQQKKKKRLRRKKKYLEEQEKPTLAIRVMPKDEWKRWKNKYLSMQKATMSQIKMSLSGVDAPSSKDSRQGARNNNQQRMDVEDRTVKKKQVQLIQFVEGAVIRLKMKEPIGKPDELKTRLRNVGKVAYVDLQEGEKVAYVRCLTSEESQRILAEVELPGKARLLEGDEEKSYWEKLQSDRQQKLSGNTKRKKGIKKVLTKVVKKQNTHITFDN